MNTKFLKSEISDITIELLNEVIAYSYSGGHNSHAPLGCSGDDFFLFGEPRRKEISLRLHSGDVKLLITDDCGNFLFYGGFDSSLLPMSFVAKQYYDIIQHVKYLIDNTKRSSSVTEKDKEEMFERYIIASKIMYGLVV